MSTLPSLRPSVCQSIRQFVRPSSILPPSLPPCCATGAWRSIVGAIPSDWDGGRTAASDSKGQFTLLIVAAGVPLHDGSGRAGLRSSRHWWWCSWLFLVSVLNLFLCFSYRIHCTCVCSLSGTVRSVMSIVRAWRCGCMFVEQCDPLRECIVYGGAATWSLYLFLDTKSCRVVC